MMLRQTLLNPRRVLGCQKPSAPGWLANSTPILFRFACGVHHLLAWLESRGSSQFPSVMWSARRGEAAAAVGRGHVGKAKGLSSPRPGHKKPFCSPPPGLTRPVMWEHEGWPGSQRTQESQRREFLCGWFLVGWWELCEAAGSFLGTQPAPQGSCTSTMAMWLGVQMGSILGKGRKGMTESGFAQTLNLAVGPPSSNAGFTFLSVVAKGRAHPSWVLWKL